MLGMARSWISLANQMERLDEHRFEIVGRIPQLAANILQRLPWPLPPMLMTLPPTLFRAREDRPPSESTHARRRLLLQIGDVFLATEISSLIDLSQFQRAFVWHARVMPEEGLRKPFLLPPIGNARLAKNVLFPKPPP
jgi:hypothetical protein